MRDRLDTLIRLAMHLRYCTTCHDSGNFSADLCRNGARLWQEAQVPMPPLPMPREWGPCPSDSERIEFYSGKLFPAGEVH